MNRRSFLAALWGTVIAWFLPVPASKPPKLRGREPKTESDPPSRVEIRGDGQGGFVVREFFDNGRRPGAGSRFVVMHHDAAETFVSKYADGKVPIPPARPSSWMGRARRLFHRPKEMFV